MINLSESTLWLMTFITMVFDGILVVLVRKSVELEKETLKILIKEYEYDEAKDIEKKQKRTKTTRKVTTRPGGETTTEESTETSEPLNQGEQK